MTTFGFSCGPRACCAATGLARRCNAHPMTTSVLTSRLCCRGVWEDPRRSPRTQLRPNARAAPGGARPAAMSARRRIASDGALSLMAGGADTSEAGPLQPPPGDGAPPLALKSCMVSADDVRLGKLLGSGSQGQVYEASWSGRPVAVKVMAEAFPRHMLGRKGSGDLGKMLEALEGACTRPDACLDDALHRGNQLKMRFAQRRRCRRAGARRRRRTSWRCCASSPPSQPGACARNAAPALIAASDAVFCASSAGTRI